MNEDDIKKSSIITIPSRNLVKVGNLINITNKIINAQDAEFSLSYIDNIRIGTQEWMNKSLDVQFYLNGDPIPEVQNPIEWHNLKSGAWCYFNNEIERGKLYNWFAVNDPRGMVPHGYRIPNKIDITELSIFLDNEYNSSKIKSIYEIKIDYMDGNRGFEGKFSKNIEHGGCWSSFADDFGCTAFQIFDNIDWMVLDGISANIGFRIWCIKNK
jgi:uncharacterized protein (TIGR02145 family)